MGGFMSTPDTSAKERSDEIDSQIEEDAKRLRCDCKVLLLGTPRSGKSTIVKQWKIIHQAGFTPDELATFVSIIQRDVFDSAYQVIAYMKKMGLECFEAENRLRAEQIYTHALLCPDSDGPILSLEIARAIHELLKDPIITEVIDEHSHDFYLMENAPYFFGEVLRVGAAGYLPNETDVLRSREKKVVGIEETQLSMGQLSINILKFNGVRGERKKWIHYFESVSTIIFCTALTDYDQVLLEERSQNHMTLSLLLFENTINSRWFLRANIVLLLNKLDLFKAQLNKVPLARHFPEYTGGNDINKATKYILRKFMQANRARLSVYPHLIQATDTSNMRLVFAAVKEIILQNSLKCSGIL